MVACDSLYDNETDYYNFVRTATGAVLPVVTSLAPSAFESGVDG